VSSDKFRNKYRIPSARAQWWDYRNGASYFITICTAHKENYFGKIINGQMALSRIGIIADMLWHEIKNHFHSVELGEFVVMPNHIHGIMIINNTENNSVVDVGILPDVETLPDVGILPDVETLHATSLQQQPSPSPSPSPQSSPSQNEFMQSISPKSKSIATVLRSYKSAVTNHVHRLGYDFAWQPRFYDRIIRNDDEYRRIACYIINNPVNWKKDKSTI
jgi:REP element-mobilizing transposase RayT